MDDLELARTIQARLVGGPVDLARTLVQSPRSTIEPQRHASAGGRSALEALRQLGASLDGKLAVHQTLGEGGMGVVHLATQATLGRHVALKTMRAGAGDVDATLRILREAWVTGALEHPNVVPIYDVGVDAAGSPVIVMKRIEGQHWGELMHAHEDTAKRFSAKDPLEWNIGILVSVCNAVHFAHSRGILHRDLKPENVMIGAFGEVYVLDWGIAISLKDDPSGRLPPASLATDVAGTPSYMAPEMLLGDPSMLSPRTDVYLLGAIFYEIFAGRPPHEGDSLEKMIGSILLSNLTFPTGFPSEAQRICRRAMSRDPGARFASAEELRVALEEYVRHRGSRKLGFEAKRSLDSLLHVIANEPSGEERALAVFNRLGECRFGYRAALAAWPENEGARKGLDRALLAVIDYELAEGDANAAATLLREVAEPPPEIVAKVEAAVRARAEQDARRKKLEGDFDPTIGSRTRSFLAATFGTLWTLSPLFGWYRQRGGEPITYLHTIIPSALFIVLGVVAYLWAKETLNKTLLNRRLASTLWLLLWGQLLLALGAWLAGMPAWQNSLLHVLAWGATEAFLAVWLERWFTVPAVACGITFVVVAAIEQRAMFPLMALCNLILTVVLLRVWFPKQDIERINETRKEIRRRARAWLLEAAANVTRGDEE